MADTPPAAIAAPAAILTAEYVAPTPNAAMEGPITPIITGAVAGVAVPPEATVTITNGIAIARLPIKIPQTTLPVALMRITFLQNRPQFQLNLFLHVTPFLILFHY